MTEPDRIAQLEAALAVLLDHVDAVGCYDKFGERIGDQVPAVAQAREVVGEAAWRRIMDEP